MRAVVLVLVMVWLSPPGLWAQNIFADGFETGDVWRWTDSVGFSCSDECNLVSQVGCVPTEKCTFFGASNPDRGCARCVDDGDVGWGGACAFDPTTGIDDCVAGLYCHEGTCKEFCSWPPETCPDPEGCFGIALTFDGLFVGLCVPQCDLFAQDCSPDKGCYIMLGRDSYPSFCYVPEPEPDPPDGCGIGLDRPGIQGECCSYINTCQPEYGCNQLNGPDFDHMVCARNCDPTGTLGSDDCVQVLGSTFWCMSINAYYANLDELPDAYGFCIDWTIWGPPECYNGVQDAHEDGIDCCVEPGGDPDCPCVYECL